MAKEMNDHQDTEHFTYDKSWGEIENMLDRAERKMNHHSIEALSSKKRDDKVYHVRNFKALQGVAKALRWVLGDMKVKDPLE
tara:strand:- start:2458 stop:2703 length:246 start_codon:yes stop_codon:yes gene_type:complete